MTKRREKGAGEKESQACWSSTSTCEKTLTLLLILTIAVLVSALIFIAIIYLKDNYVCNSSFCIQSSAKLLNTIDVDKSPCTDLEQFTCGNEILQADYLESETELMKLKLISTPVEEGDSELTVVKNFFQTCTNDTAIEEDDNRMLKTIINSLGGWPLLLGAKWNGDNFSWIDFMIKLRKLGLKYELLIEFRCFEDRDGTLVMLSPPSRLAPLKHDDREYYETMVNVAIKMDSSVEFAWKELRKVVDFQHDLANIAEKARNRSAEDRLENYPKLDVEKLNQFWPAHNVVEVLNSLARGYAVFSKDSKVIVKSESYLYDLNTLLMKTPKRTQANYFIWKIIEDYLPFSSKSFRGIYDGYSRLGSRQHYCFQEVSKRFYNIIQTAYLSQYFREHADQSLKQMVNLIKGDIMDGDFNNPTTDVILEGLSGDYRRPTYNLKSKNLLVMITEINLSAEDEFFHCFHRNYTPCVKKYDTDEGHRLVDVLFDPKQNIIFVPPSLLQSKWYNINQPNFINYGRIGRKIGETFIQNLKWSNISREKEETGLDLAYAGYIKSVQENGLEKRLPGLEFDTRQLFWLFANAAFCNTKDSAMKFEEATNSYYFRKDFNC